MKQRQIRTYDSEYVELMNKSNDQTEITNQIYNPPVVEAAINEGDTLQSLSIKYHCPVAELKRLNNLHRENEIYARRTIKLPYRFFSMVAIHKSGDSSPNSSALKKTDLEKKVNPNVLKEKLETVSTTDNLINVDNFLKNSENRVNEIIFNTKISDNLEKDEECSDEEVQLLPNSIEIQTRKGTFDCSGSDWGLSWPLLLAIILLTAFVGPLIYIFYIAEHPEKFHHHHIT